MKGMIFSRSTGRMMQEMKYTGLGADCIMENATVFVKPHPKGKDYKSLMPYEKQRTALWSEDSVYRLGISPDLDLLEYAGWMRFYPENIKFTVKGRE